MMQRTATSGTATVNPPVDNDGDVNTAVANGVIVLNGGTTGTSTGDYGSAAAPGTIDFATGTHFLGNGSRILGSVNITGATLQVAAGATTTVSGANTHEHRYWSAAPAPSTSPAAPSPGRAAASTGPAQRTWQRARR